MIIKKEAYERWSTLTLKELRDDGIEPPEGIIEELQESFYEHLLKKAKSSCDDLN